MRRHHPMMFAATLIAMSACSETKKPTPAPVASVPAPSTTSGTLGDLSTPAAGAGGSPAQTAAPTRIAAQHLLVAYRGAAAAPKTVTRTREQARERAREAAKRAQGGEDFSALVAEYSDDPTARDRGNLGMFARESKDKAFADAAFALLVGAVSDVVETRYGFHVIKRNQ